MSLTCGFTGGAHEPHSIPAGQTMIICVRGGLHPNPNACCPVSSQLGAGHEAGTGPVDQVDDDRVRGFAGADRRNGLLPAYAHPRRAAWPARVGRSPNPLSVDGMIVAASTTLLADSRSGRRGGALPWALLIAGSIASLAANVAVAQPHHGRPDDRGLAKLCPDRLLRTVHPPGTPQRHQPAHGHHGALSTAAQPRHRHGRPRAYGWAEAGGNAATPHVGPVGASGSRSSAAGMAMGYGPPRCGWRTA
jgi:hypothetical protein